MSKNTNILLFGLAGVAGVVIARSFLNKNNLPSPSPDGTLPPVDSGGQGGGLIDSAIDILGGLFGGGNKLKITKANCDVAPRKVYFNYQGKKYDISYDSAFARASLIGFQPFSLAALPNIQVTVLGSKLFLKDTSKNQTTSVDIQTCKIS